MHRGSSRQTQLNPLVPARVPTAPIFDFCIQYLQLLSEAPLLGLSFLWLPPARVQDKKHVLFLCPCLEMCCLRRRFEEQFADFADWTYIGDTGAFYFENIGAEDVKLFLLKQIYKSFLFLSETKDIFLSGWQCPASPAVNPSG